MNIDLNPNKVLRYLLIIIIVLLAANILVNFIDHNYYSNDGILAENKYLKILIQLFDFDTEDKNIPTYYSAVSLLLSSLVLYIIALNNNQNRSKRYYWIGLSIIFTYLSLDEILALHEHLTRLTQEVLDLPQKGFHHWLIPYASILIILSIVYLRFFLSLSKATLKRFIVAAILYVFGILVFEIMGSFHSAKYGMSNITYVILYTMEELFEMLGVAVFIYALLNFKKVSIVIK